ncbi:MAG: bifunctional riboflavin kinase/FAD synthetase [Prevotella sp.]
MRIIHLDHLTHLSAPCAATIGFFDGLHRGHQFLLQQVVEKAKEEGLSSMAITFDLHPRMVLNAEYIPQMLCTLEEKLELLEKSGIDFVTVIHFTPQLASMPARQFMNDILLTQLGVRCLVIGYDNRFGKDRSEAFPDYVSYGKSMNMEVIEAKALIIDGMNVSSSLIRKSLRSGKIDLANRCLGHIYGIKGTVVSGHHEGRRMGFPTANLDNGDSDLIVPAPGVYATLVHIEGHNQTWHGMTNIGMRPTFGGHHMSIETHIIGFSEDIYGRKMEIRFVGHVREERKFASAAELVLQLQADTMTVEEMIKKGKYEEQDTEDYH